MSRFGGHEKFALRDGWLPKSLGLLRDERDLFKDPLACDRLGVGTNMAKSIYHWLQITGLIEKRRKKEVSEISKVGKLILQKDPYFLRIGTWWALHINAVTQSVDAIAWRWFFNHAYTDRFDRFRFASDLLRQMTIKGERLPTTTTLNNDISCMLSSYASTVPPSNKDPEEGLDCPFQSLGLLTHYRETDSYKANRKVKDIPSELVGYAFSVSTTASDSGSYITKSLSQTHTSPDGPGKTLVLDIEAFNDTMQKVEDELGSNIFHVELSGGERTVRFIRQEPIRWLRQYYQNQAK